MIVKTKRGYYVYSNLSKTGRRRLIGGPYATKAVAQKVSKRMLKK